MIKVVFFDVGGTLIEPFPSVGDIYSRVAAKHGVTMSPAVLNEKFKQVWKEKKPDRLTVDKNWWGDVVTAIFENQRFSNEQAFFDELYATFAYPQAWKIYGDVIETLDQLKQRSVRLAVASNWDSRLPALLDQLGLSSYFEHFFISFEMGLQKPNPEFFRRALQKMAVDPIEALHVGDDVEEDIRGAEAAGLRAYHINRREKPINSRMLVDLKEVLLRL
jgi:putative hydrolase of the HAD superfamily